MRMGMSVSLAAGMVALALLSPVGNAGAAPRPGAPSAEDTAQGVGAARAGRTICRRYWNGYRWRSRCFWVPGDGYWGPRPWRRPSWYQP